MDAVERLGAGEAFECLDAEAELAHRERALAAEAAVPQTVERRAAPPDLPRAYPALLTF